MRRHHLAPVCRVGWRSALESGFPGSTGREETASYGVFSELDIERVNSRHQPVV
jgi:hypothetical protein